MCSLNTSSAAGRAGGKAHAPKAPVDLAPSPAKDLKYLHRTLRREAKEDAKISGASGRSLPAILFATHGGVPSLVRKCSTRVALSLCLAGELPPDRSSEMLALQEAVSLIVEEEEALLSEHMSALQESAELLSEEGRLLAQVQGNDVIDYDIDAYATRLDQVRPVVSGFSFVSVRPSSCLHQILRRKLDLTSKLLGRLTLFRCVHLCVCPCKCVFCCELCFSHSLYLCVHHACCMYPRPYLMVLVKLAKGRDLQGTSCFGRASEPAVEHVMM